MVKVKLLINSLVFEGDVPPGAKSGTFVCSENGAKYDGEFAGSEITGYGTMVWASGNIYTGNWVNGSRQGLGEEKFPDGEINRGEWSHNNRNGLFETLFVNGQVHRGSYMSGMKHGPGVQTWPDGQIYSGDFLKDKQHGFAVMRYASGNQYIGEFSVGIQHGRGRSVLKSSGIVKDRIWDNGKETGTPCNVTDLIIMADKGLQVSLIASIDLYITAAAKAKVNADGAINGWYRCMLVIFDGYNVNDVSQSSVDFG